MIPSRSAKVAAIALLFAVGAAGQAFAQFETRASVSVSTEPVGLAVGDFNRDGKADLAVADYLPLNGVTVLIGNGDGTFTVGPYYPVGVQVSSVVAADLRHNGTLDLVVGDSLSDDLYVMLGNGDGTFGSAVAYPAIGQPFTVATGDFNGDGRLDIIAITSSAQCDCVSVFLGNGDGTFQSGVNTPVPYNIAGTALAPGNFNSDGKLDVAVTGVFGSASQVDILLGNGDGTFRPHGFYKVLSPSSVVAADFNGDQKTDLAVAATSGNSVSVFLGNGDGTFRKAVNYSTQGPLLLVAHDLDRDGKLDLVATNSGDSNVSPGVSVLKGNGDGTFQQAAFYPISEEQGGHVAVGDFNSDGKPDIVAANYIGQAIVTLLNTGVVAFSPTTPITFPNQLVGTTSSPLSATLTNNGTSSLTISSVTYSGSPFHVQTTCKGSIAPGGTCNISASFSPQVIDVSLGTVTIKDSASSKPQVIELTGTGTVMKLAPSQLIFPPQKVGTKGHKQIQVTNTGSTPVDFTQSIYVTGPDFMDFWETDNCPKSLAAGASCTVTILFKPTKTGSFTDTVYVTDTGGGSPQTVPVSGTGD